VARGNEGRKKGEKGKQSEKGRRNGSTSALRDQKNFKEWNSVERQGGDAS